MALRAVSRGVRYVARMAGRDHSSAAGVGRYDVDVLRAGHPRRRAVPEVAAELDLVVEDADSGFCGAVVGFDSGAVVLEDRFGKRRVFPLVPAGFLLDGAPVTLVRRLDAGARPGLTRDHGNS